MATLIQIHALVSGSPELEQRFLSARLKAAWDIINEAPETQNHQARLAWANKIISNYTEDKSKEYNRFLSNTTIQTNGSTSSDSDIQYVVNSLIETYIS